MSKSTSLALEDDGEHGIASTYKYWHSDMGGSDSSMTGIKSFRKFATFNRELTTPLVISEGKKAVVTVSYDISRSFVVVDSSDSISISDDCTSVNDVSYCFILPAFSMTAAEVTDF